MVNTDKFEDITEIASNPQKLRLKTEEMIGFGDGNTGGYIQVKQEFNLNALAIGLGLENIEYEPKRFPGLVYRHTCPDATAILFEDGHLTVIDAPGEDEVRDVIISTIERLRDLDLCEVASPDEDDVNVSKT